MCACSVLLQAARSGAVHLVHRHRRAHQPLLLAGAARRALALHPHLRVLAATPPALGGPDQAEGEPGPAGCKPDAKLWGYAGKGLGHAQQCLRALVLQARDCIALRARFRGQICPLSRAMCVRRS
eukprot:1806055-Rhodomonas_salina.2